jgi:hypothetical protein
MRVLCSVYVSNILNYYYYSQLPLYVLHIWCSWWRKRRTLASNSAMTRFITQEDFIACLRCKSFKFCIGSLVHINVTSTTVVLLLGHIMMGHLTLFFLSVILGTSLYTVVFPWRCCSKVKVKVILRLTVSRPVCLSVKHPSGAYDQICIIVRQLLVCWCGALSLTRDRVCRLQLLLVLATAVILGSESRWFVTKFYCLRFETSPTWRASSLYLYPSGTRWPSYPPGIGFPFRRLLRLAELRWTCLNPLPHRVLFPHLSLCCCSFKLVFLYRCGTDLQKTRITCQDVWCGPHRKHRFLYCCEGILTMPLPKKRSLIVACTFVTECI